MRSQGSPGRNAMRRQKGKPSSAASKNRAAEIRSSLRDKIGTFNPAPGIARRGWPGVAGAEK